MNDLLEKSTQTAQKAAQMIGGSFEQGVGFKPIKPITPGDLSYESSPLNIPPISPATQADGMLASLEAGIDIYTKQLNDKAKAAEEGKNTSLEQYIRAQARQKGEQQVRGEKYSEAVDPLQAELDDINSQILQEQNANRRRIEALEKNPQGLETDALDAEIRRVNTESLRRQADLSIIQMARQGRYDSAKAIADRAVSAIMEQQKINLDALRFIYEENKDEFSKAEQRAFEVAQNERERKFELETYKERARFDQALAQSDPLYKLKLEREEKEIALLGEPTPTERKAAEEALREAQASIPVMQDKINAVEVLKNHPGLRGSVGPYKLARFTPFEIDKAAKQEFAGGVHKLIGGLTLQNLIDAKNRGATFGALSDAELNILANSATALNDWEVKDKNGKGTGVWAIDEASFRRELDTIKELTQRAIIQSGGSLLEDSEQAALDELFNNAQTTDPSSYY